MVARIPQRGHARESLLAEMGGFASEDADYKAARTWSLVYWAGEEHHALVKEAYNLFMATNALNPMAFRSLKRMEREVVQMTAGLLGGDEATVGTMTSGGTESLLLAVKTYRDRARKRRPWVRRPNMVVPSTIHVAFDKAAHLFGVRKRAVAVGSDGRADVAAMARAVDRNTILLAGSAPQYPHGAVDPIPELAALALERRLPLHVDACFGGFILPWLERLGVAMPAWDFRVPGVTSISADVHKFGYAPKGASVILYRDVAILRHQFFVATGWSGGIYASPSLPGTRPGGAIAAAWASLMGLGEDGFMALAERTWQAAEALREGIRGIPELTLLGRPESPIVTYGVRDGAVDLFAVADQLQARGWAVDRQQDPPSVHCSATGNHLAVVPDYLADLRAAVEYVKAHPELAREGEAAVYGLMARVPLKGLVDREVLKVLEAMYGPGDGELDLAARQPGGDGLVGKLMERYGERALGALEGLTRARRRLRRLLRRR